VRRLLALTLALLAFGGVLTACGSSSKDDAASTDKPAKTAELEADDFYFDPTGIALAAGNDTIEVDNNGDALHNLTVEGLDVDQDLKPGTKTKVSVDAKPGTYKFHCEYHPTKMKGTITVS
jgi:plastocyanin